MAHRPREQRGSVVNLGKTKVLIFHTFAQVRTKCYVTLSHRQVEEVGSYAYLGITFNACSSKFSMTHENEDRLIRGYASLSLLERQSHQRYFQEPRIKG